MGYSDYNKQTKEEVKMKSKKEGLSLQAIVIFKSIYQMTHSENCIKDGEGTPICVKTKNKFATDFHLSVRSIHIHLNELIEYGLIESRKVKTGNYAGKVCIYVNDDVYKAFKKKIDKTNPDRFDKNKNQGPGMPGVYTISISSPHDLDFMSATKEFMDEVRKEAASKNKSDNKASRNK